MYKEEEKQIKFDWYLIIYNIIISYLLYFRDLHNIISSQYNILLTIIVLSKRVFIFINGTILFEIKKSISIPSWLQYEYIVQST